MKAIGSEMKVSTLKQKQGVDSLELALYDSTYENMVVKFAEHFIWIASAIDRIGDNNDEMWDETEFLGEFGIRALSRAHAKKPFAFWVTTDEFKVEYIPGDSNSFLFGGNSNWRGPIWMPVNVLILRALLQHYLYYGDAFKVECPVGSGRMMNLYEVNEEGTEAAAATAVEMQTTSVKSYPVLRADHPFLFLIRDNQTGSILFMGRMVDPSIK
jgi:hypothetical protein